MPHAVDRLRFREKPVTADIKAVTLVFFRARQSANHGAFFQDGTG